MGSPQEAGRLAAAVEATGEARSVATFSNLSAGPYVLTAVAADSEGVETVSDTFAVRVEDAPLAKLRPRRRTRARAESAVRRVAASDGRDAPAGSYSVTAVATGGHTSKPPPPPLRVVVRVSEARAAMPGPRRGTRLRGG